MLDIWLSSVLCFRVSPQGHNQGVTQLKAKLLWLLAIFSSLWALGMKISVPCWLLARGCLSSLLHGPLYVVASFIGSSKGGRVLIMEDTVLCNLITEVTFQHLCHILLIRRKIQALSTLREGIVQRCAVQEV